MMNDILDKDNGDPNPLKAEGYMDDLMPHGETREECRRNTICVLTKLNKHGLCLNAEKCVFEEMKVEYLGMIVQHNELRMDPTKVEGLANWPQPKTVKQVRSFLGFGNFYQKFICHYSNIASLMNALTRKDQQFEWTKECKEAFQTLKRKFMSYPVLWIPDPTKPFQIEADTSKTASRAVLTQLDENGAQHPVAFISKSFSNAKRNYQIYN